MRRVSEKRLRDLESRIPPAMKALLIRRVIVESNPVPGGPPIICGVLRRMTKIFASWVEPRPPMNLPPQFDDPKFDDFAATSRASEAEGGDA